MDEDGVPLAFCPLLWRSNGGRFDERGRPLIEAALVRGNCTRPYDCSDCEHMRLELSYHPQDEIQWVCPQCASLLKNRRDLVGKNLLMPGYFTEGICESVLCRREEEAKHSSFLQLVIGKIKKEES
jgi:hypothetical protein